MKLSYICSVLHVIRIYEDKNIKSVVKRKIEGGKWKKRRFRAKLFTEKKLLCVWFILVTVRM